MTDAELGEAVRQIYASPKQTPIQNLPPTVTTLGDLQTSLADLINAQLQWKPTSDSYDGT